MRRLILLMFSFLMFFTVVAQTDGSVDKKAERKKAKQEKKEEEKKKREWMAQVTKQMIEERKFVLEADYVNSADGNLIPVSPDLNFIIIDTTYAMFQLGSLDGTGFGNMGTLTFDGEVTTYEVNRTEKKNYTAWDLVITVFSNVGTYTVSLSVADDGTAEAYIRGSGSGMVNYTGILYPHKASKIFKGQKLN